MTTPPLPAPVSDRHKAFCLAERILANNHSEQLLTDVLDELLVLFDAENAMVIHQSPGANPGRRQAVREYRVRPGAVLTDGDEQKAFSAVSRMLTELTTDPDHFEGGLAGVCLALKHQGYTFGALYIGTLKPIEPSSEQELRALTSLIALSLVRASQEQELQERLAYVEKLNLVFQNITQSLDLRSVLNMILQMTLELLKAERALVLLGGDDGLQVAAARDRSGDIDLDVDQNIVYSTAICQKVLETQQGVTLYDAGNDREFSARHSVVGMNIRGLLAVPMHGQSGIQGILYVDSTSTLPSDLDRELSVITAIAKQGTILVENARLLRLATIDALTGLYIRSYFMNRLEEEWRRVRRYGGRMSLLVIDVDHFKKFNDNYGHQVGDLALQVVARRIVEGVRIGVDLVGRYGGEEFLVLLPETDAAGALVAAERIRARIHEAGLSLPDGRELPVSVSIGIGAAPEHTTSPADLFNRADQALYLSKHGGRNRCTIYEDPA